MRLLLSITAALLLSAGFSACSSSTDPYSDAPPELPSVQTMQMGFSLFSDGKNHPQGLTLAEELNGELNRDTPYSNFLQAAVRAMTINGALAAHTALPASLLATAASAEPELNENGEWEWSYRAKGLNRSADVRLTASLENGQIQWNLYLSQTEANIENQRLFTGLSSPDNRSGSWTYFERSADAGSTDIDNPEPISELTWSVAGRDNYTLQLDILTDRNDREGDALSASQDEDIKETLYTEADADEPIRTEIEWNTETNEGHLITPSYNGGLKACWSRMLTNTSC